MTNDRPSNLGHRLIAAIIAGTALVIGASLTVNWLAARPDDVPLIRVKGDAQPSSRPATAPAVALPGNLFQSWPANRKPDVALILTGQQFSYLKFCGCSEKQLGGFERRFNFMAQLRERGWPIVALDLGDLVTRQPGGLHAQTLLKYETAMKALEVLGYSAIGLGENEYKLPLIEALSLFTLQKPNADPRVLAANLKDRVAKFPANAQESMIGDWLTAGGKDGVPKIGVASLAGLMVTNAVTQFSSEFQFEDNGRILTGVLAAMDKANVDLKVLLYHGDIDAAKILAGDPKLAANAPLVFRDKFDVILCLSAEEEPPAKPDIVGKTMIIRIGHRGRHVGVVGAYKTGKPERPYELHYQFVAMGEEYETEKPKEEGHKILKLLDEYAKQVKSQNFLAAMPRAAHPVQAAFPQANVAFVGSARCQQCHPAEVAIWEKTKHSHAYEALTKKADKPKLRQYDPECVVCHTVGYANNNGYSDEVKTKHLLHVGCENCHGPGSLHSADKDNRAYYPHLSPWKSQPNELLPTADKIARGLDGLTKPEKDILLRVDQMCQKCHDTDNDPRFKFEKYWPVIVHGKSGGPKPGTKLVR
ncbi:MAG: multiheme c-type cytochrome [Gemmataceae bacterium]